MIRTWVVSDASGDGEPECSFFHFWTPNGLTRSSGREHLDSALRAGWSDTLIVRATTHRAAMEKAKAAFDRRRARRRRPTTIRQEER